MFPLKGGDYKLEVDVSDDREAGAGFGLRGLQAVILRGKLGKASNRASSEIFGVSGRLEQAGDDKHCHTSRAAEALQVVVVSEPEGTEPCPQWLRNGSVAQEVSLIRLDSTTLDPFGLAAYTPKSLATLILVFV